MKTCKPPALSALALAAVLFASLCIVGQTHAQQFENKGDVNLSAFTTLGSVEITVNPAFRPIVQNSTPTGFTYDPTTGILRSQQLYDPNGTMGISDPLLDGSASDTNGVAVGTANTNVAESNLTPPPGWGKGINTWEEHTKVISLNMTLNGGTAFRIGSAAADRPASYGEMESLSGPAGAPANDFPAVSFFDVFADVDLPGLDSGQGVTTLYNSAPLIFNSTDASGSYGFMNLSNPANPTPPNTPGVPLYFKNNSNSNSWFAGDAFGTYRLFNYIGQPQQTPEPALIGLFPLAATLLRRRRQR